MDPPPPEPPTITELANMINSRLDNIVEMLGKIKYVHK